ncbi:macro domain-containing protein [Lapidilactobacillus wuchangensis]|uniref:macro domain-containing protein n=1 Tax=Lapidilactobacillus wuchangensis TaxID=2486001 RepID=UPI000F781FDA|nr:macro domain-containing protein [Lapidilactobacillus wuchangensis]
MTKLCVQFSGFMVRIYQGDLTKVATGAIVNAANQAMIPGGGVDGAINQAAGPSLAPLQRSLGPLAVGQAVATPAFALPATKIIHTVGPQYDSRRPQLMAAQLQDCYQNSLRLANQLQLPALAFPAISTGVYHYPVAQTLPIIGAVLTDYQQQVGTVKQIDFVNYLATINQQYQNYFRQLGLPVQMLGD